MRRVAALGLAWTLACGVAAAEVPVGSLVVDGDAQDWLDLGIEPLLLDPAGDREPSGEDLRALYAADDGEHVFFLLLFEARATGTSFVKLDVDVNADTGCSGAEFALTLRADAIGDSYLGDARNCGWGPNDYPGALVAARRFATVEASVPLATLASVEPDVSEFEVTCSNDACDPARYVIRETPLCDIAMSQPSYAVGDTVTVASFRLANLGATAEAVELKTWFAFPGGPPVPFLRAGGDGSLVFPAGLDAELGPFPLFEVTPTTPVGTYELSCRLLDPVTGERQLLDENPFDVE